MICFTETASIYKMKGCSHTICTECSIQMKDMESSFAYPYSNIFTLTVESICRLKCPYCRQKEPVDITLKIPSVREYLTLRFKKYKKKMEAYPYQWSLREIVEDFCEWYNYQYTQHAYIQYKSCLRKYYKLWMDLELRFDGEKSCVLMPFKRYWFGKRKNIYRTWIIYKDDDNGEIDLNSFISSDYNKKTKHRKQIGENRPNLKNVKRMKRFNQL
jgi:hypothetical protein